VLLSAEKGKCIYDFAKESIAASVYTNIVKGILQYIVRNSV